MANPNPVSRKGKKNKTTLGIEEAGGTATASVAKTFGALQKTKEHNLTAWAKANPDLFYTKVFPKIIPQARGPEDNAQRQEAIFINDPPPEQWTKTHNLAPEDWSPPQIPV